MRNGLHPRRRIVTRTYYRAKSAPWNSRPSVIVKLECGHEKMYTGARTPRTDARVECRLCPKEKR